MIRKYLEFTILRGHADLLYLVNLELIPAFCISLRSAIQTYFSDLPVENIVKVQYTAFQ